MPAGGGPRMRDELGHGVSLTSDLYIDDACIFDFSSPHVRAPCARRTAAAVDALCDAGAEVHADKGHSDELDRTMGRGVLSLSGQRVSPALTR